MKRLKPADNETPLDVVVRKATEAEAETFRSLYYSDGGTPYRKPEKRQAIERERLITLVEVLDHAFKWGQTPFEIHDKLRENAVKHGLLVRKEYSYGLPEVEVWEGVPVR